MADKTLLFKTNASMELNAVQTLEPRIEQADALGARTLTETSSRVLTRDKNGNLVGTPILTDMLNSEFVNVIRRDGEGKADDGLWVTFSSTSNAENGGVSPEKSLLVSMKDLMLTINIPNDVSLVTTTPITEDSGDPEDPTQLDVPCRWWGKPITLDQIDPEKDINVQVDNWNLIADRKVRLHKNNGQSVAGKWSLDLERIAKRTPDVLFLEVGENDTLIIHLDPKVQQAIPVIFTPDDGQEVFKLLLFIDVFDQRTAQKKMKVQMIPLSEEHPETQFLKPFVMVDSVDSETMTGGIGESGALKVVDNVNVVTETIAAVDLETKQPILVDSVTIIPKVSAFSTDGSLDSIKLPSVPSEFDEENPLKDLVENGKYTTEAVVSAFGYESVTTDVCVAILSDERNPRLTLIVSSEAMNMAKTITNESDAAGKVTCHSRHNESDKIVDTNLSITGISGRDGDTTKVLTISAVNEFGDDTAPTLFVVSGENGDPTGYVLAKCECSGYVTETVKLPVKITDERLPDAKPVWNIDWDIQPSIGISEEQSQSLPMTIKATSNINATVAKPEYTPVSIGYLNSNEITNQWGQTETLATETEDVGGVDEMKATTMVVGVVDDSHPLTIDTVDEVTLPADALEHGCWINISVVTESGLLINKKVQASVIVSENNG